MYGILIYVFRVVYILIYSLEEIYIWDIVFGSGVYVYILYFNCSNIVYFGILIFIIRFISFFFMYGYFRSSFRR